MSSIRPGRRGASVRSTAWVPALLLLSMFWCHRSDARAQSGTDRTGSSLESGVDTSIRPGDDFFAYANGGWLKATTIPAGKERWGARNEIEGLTRQQVATLFGDAVLAPAGSSARKVSDFRAAYLNDGAIEAQGLTPLKSPLDSIDRLRDKTALSSYLGRDLRAAVDPPNPGLFDSAHPPGPAAGRWPRTLPKPCWPAPDSPSPVRHPPARGRRPATRGAPSTRWPARSR